MAKWQIFSKRPSDGEAERPRDFDADRALMIELQLAARGIRTPRILDAVASVPRERFLPLELRPFAYDDRPLDIGAGQTISQPYMVGLMTQLLEPKTSDVVLEIGTGSGYQAAILAALVRQVHTVERIEALARQADWTLRELGIGNVAVHVGDGTLGWPDAAPYDAIVVTAGGPRIPESLKSQLALGGRLVCPVGGHDRQRLLRIVRQDDAFQIEESVECVFVPLIGRDGWA